MKRPLLRPALLFAAGVALTEWVSLPWPGALVAGGLCLLLAALGTGARALFLLVPAVLLLAGAVGAWVTDRPHAAAALAILHLSALVAFHVSRIHAHCSYGRPAYHWPSSRSMSSRTG